MGRSPNQSSQGNLIAKNLQMVEQENPRAHPLTEITSVEDGEDEVSYAEFGLKGVFTSHTRKIKKVKMPEDPEALSARYNVMDNVLYTCALSMGTSLGFRTTTRACSMTLPIIC